MSIGCKDQPYKEGQVGFHLAVGVDVTMTTALGTFPLPGVKEVGCRWYGMDASALTEADLDLHLAGLLRDLADDLDPRAVK
jgi:hypothetical protein